LLTLTSQKSVQHLVQFAKSLNPTWDNTDAVFWTFLEVNITVIVLCLPAIRIFLARRLPAIFGSASDKSHPSKLTASSHSMNTARGVPKRSRYKDLADGSKSRGSSRRPWDHDIEMNETLETLPLSPISLSPHSLPSTGLSPTRPGKPETGTSTHITAEVPANKDGIHRHAKQDSWWRLNGPSIFGPKSPTEETRGSEASE
jgi:hypothetical protein